MTRPAVHAASGHRLGASEPRQEGPTDLRLVPPALAAWGAAALAVGASGRWMAGFVVACVAVAGGLLAIPSIRSARASGTRRGLNADASATATATAVAAALLCAAAGAASAGLHTADLHRGPVPGLADQYSRVTAELTVTSDARMTRPRVRGANTVPTSVVFDADVTRVSGPDRVAATVRTPVLVIAPAHGPASAQWQRLLPSAELRLTGRLAPAMPGGGDRIAAVLRVSDGGLPVVTGPPTAVQRTAGDLRAGLREATEGLAPDARALLPGLVVGDTSRVPPELHDAFAATDLTHLLAVSGDNLSWGYM
ncbi:hypothetical protein J7I98_04530 [Streptomyces sp. ISL-98]|uniref:ComEC/Rec2 family competence protein n=1 Tax=Streptomyces sp. ISL-98 TaxID=2819192 RepID=UPI001BEB8B52|nr:hypothetical protein [Streptomyces sp. ISL-98]